MIRSLLRFRGATKPYRAELAVGAVMVLLMSIGGVLAPWPLKVIVDNVLKRKPLTGPIGHLVGSNAQQNPEHLLVVALVALFGIVVFGALAEYLSTMLLDGVGERITADLRQQVFAHLQRLSLSFHDHQRAGDLTTRIIADVDYVQEMLVASLSSLLPNVTVLAGIIGVMVYVDAGFSLMALSVAPLLFLTVFTFTRRIKKASKIARRKESEVASLVSETLSSMKVVQSYTLEGLHYGQFRERNTARLNAGLQMIGNQAKMSPVVDLIATGGTAIVLWFGVHRVLSGTMSLGTLLVFQSYLGQLYKPMRSLSKLASVMSRGQASADRVYEVLAADALVPESPDAVEAPPFRGDISLQRVTYGFKPDQPVIDDVSVDVAAGEMVALVGPTGAGKSTLAGFISRLYDPWHGSVTIDGRDVRSMTLKSLRRQIAIVLQDSILFHGSIYDNIACGAEHPTSDQIFAAAEIAYVDEFVRELPEGYDTIVSERGTTLSGGQRQRIAIARAIVRNTPIVILDEPTSNLDAVSERYVMRALENLTKGRTVIVIAHRLSTLRNAQRIYVIDHGHVQDVGTHDDLVARDGLYKSMYAAQVGDAAVIDLRSSAAARRFGQSSSS
jgi:subfamily B ATP-binding cassette protein MsbA